MSTIDDIAARLQTAGVGTVGTDIFKAAMPPSPDNCVTVYEYAGSPPDYGDGDIDNPSIQVRTRNTSYPTGMAKALSVQTALHKLANITLNSTYYLVILAIQSPESLGKDQSGRWEWVQNFRIVKRA